MSKTKKYIKSLEGQTHFVLGDEAAAYGAVFAGCNFFAGYPITPATEIAETLARELPRTDGYFLQMEDELASLSAVIGAAWAGGKAMTATSGPGFSLMQENIGFACMTETPCVITNVQRSGPSTGQATKTAQGDIMQARWGTHGDHRIIALSPSSVQECFDMMIDCFNFSEEYRTPVIFLIDGEIGHIREKLIIPPLDQIKCVRRKKASQHQVAFGGALVPPMIELGDRRGVHITGSTHREDGMRELEVFEVHDRLIRRQDLKIEKNREKIVKIESHFLTDAEAAVVAYGATARPAFGAVLKARENGAKIGFMRLLTLWPFPQRQIAELAKNVSRIYFPEMNLGQVCREVERFAECQVIPISKIGGFSHTIKEIQEVIQGTP